MNVDFSFAVAESKQRLDLIFQERLPLASPWNTNSEWLLLILLAIQDEVSEFMKREAVPWDPWNWLITISWKWKCTHFKILDSTLTQTQKMVEVAETSGNHLIQSLCSRQVTWSWLPSTVPFGFFSVSEDGDSAGPVLSHPHNIKGFLMFRGPSCVSVCARASAGHWALLRRACFHPVFTLPSGV